MARGDEGIPPPVGKGRRGPEMMAEDPSIGGKLDKLAAQGGGDMMGGEGGDEQSAQLLMSGAQQLMQAMQMNPNLQPFVTQALQILQQGVQQMAGREGEMGPEAGGGKPKKKRKEPPPSEQEAGAGMDQFGGAY